MMERSLERFIQENPFDFDLRQIEKLKKGLADSKKDTVFDEVVDYRLWIKELRSRQEYFADFIENFFSCDKYAHLLEVGCGHMPRLSYLLSQKGYKMSALDPNLDDLYDGISAVKDYFDYQNTPISMYDAIVAQEPCEATEHIVRACKREKKNFMICLCGTPHLLINGKMPASLKDWYDYLVSIDAENIMLVYPDMIPGYVTPILLGLFKKIT